MSFSEISDRQAILDSLSEFDRLGRERFLEKYGFGRAKEYYLAFNGKLYDSKAIIGAAHKYQFPERGALKPTEFSGGELTVKRKLEELGFEVEVQGISTLKPGQILTNTELASTFKVSLQGGMRRSTRTNTLVLISNHVDSVYEDRWESGIFHYTGMGLKGDQSLDFMQNKTLADSNSNGVEIHLFEAFENNRYTYQGKVKLEADPYNEQQLGADGQLRKVWIFPLRLVEGPLLLLSEERFEKKQEIRQRQAARLSDKELRRRVAGAPPRPGQRQTISTQYERNAYIGEMAKRRANGVCQLCNCAAPFKDKTHLPFLEVHHITWLSKGGEDRLENAVALCPNCHRKMHILDRDSDKQILHMKARGDLGSSTELN